MKVLRQATDTKHWAFDPDTGWVIALIGPFDYGSRVNGRHLFSKSYLVWL